MALRRIVNMTDADVPSSLRNTHSWEMAFDSKEWEKIDALFERLLDSGDPSLLDRERDRPIAEAVRRLYDQHLKAVHEGFLSETITLVRGLKSEEPAVFSVGEIVSSRFTVLSMLGTGGMGQVYLAQDQRLGAPVALKTIRPSLAKEERFRKRFIAEVQTAHRVTHRNVCRIFDIDDHGEVPFYSMEFVPGVRLDEFLDGGNPNPELSRDIVIQLAEGLHAAHEVGVVHGDFKPQNVILRSGEGDRSRAVITDFGLARILGETPGPVSRSIEAGTPEYLAPELEAGGSPSFKSDVYAFGKVASKLLPGWKHLCCAVDPERRPSSLLPLIRELRGPGYSRRWLIGTAGVAVATGGLLFRQPSRPKFPLLSRQRMILNGFTSSPELTEDAYKLRRLLLFALRQSPLLSVLPDERLRAVLVGLSLPSDLPVPLVHLNAAARTEHAALILDGGVDRLSRGIGLVLRVFVPDRQEPVFEVHQVAQSDKDAVNLVDRAATEMREEFGESSLSLRSASSLETVTSASPEAIDLYFRAMREYERTDTQAALAFLDRAVAIDKRFALAHHQRAMCLWASTQTEPAMQAIETAFQLRDRVTERERNWIEFFYYNLNGDFLKSLGSIRKNATLYPDEAVFQRQTASTYCQLRQYDTVIPYNVRAVDLDPYSENTRSEHLVNLVSCGRPDEALAVWQRYVKEGVTTTLLGWGSGLAYLCKGEYRKADDCFATMGSTSSRALWARLLRAGPAIFDGRFAETAFNLEADLAIDTTLADGLRRYQTMQVLGSLRILMDEPERARPLVSALCTLPPRGHNIRYLRAGVRQALDLKDRKLAAEGLERLRGIERRSPSTHSQGAAANAAALILAHDNPKAAEPLFARAMGLWPDALTLESFAWWQGATQQWDAQHQTLDRLLRFRGAIHRDDFHSLIVLAWIDQAQSSVRMSHFSDASRIYKRVLSHWGSQARQYPIVQRVRLQLETLAQ
ncbi:MAG: serine/threonine-protein kinase [Bryobacteraceae bacterium]